jgi:hypothetical protein
MQYAISLGETRKPFDLIAAEQGDRRFYVGAEMFLHEKIEVHNLQALFRVTEGGSPKGDIFLDVYNIKDEELSPMFIFVLPPDIKNVTTSSAGSVQARPYDISSVSHRSSPICISHQHNSCNSIP